MPIPRHMYDPYARGEFELVRDASAHEAARLGARPQGERSRCRSCRAFLARDNALGVHKSGLCSPCYQQADEQFTDRIAYVMAANPRGDIASAFRKVTGRQLKTSKTDPHQGDPL